MQGIDEISAKSFLDRNKDMWDAYKKGKTMEQIGDEYGVTKQRVHQIIRRCKLGDGDYYYGTQIARNKWSEFKNMYDDLDQTKRAFDDWLKERDIKLIANNQKAAPHTGWDWSG